MYKLDAFRLNSRYVVAFGALVIGAVALSAPATAASPPLLFSLMIPPPVQSAPAQITPNQNQGSTVE